MTDARQAPVVDEAPPRERILLVVAAIPEGRVATYGEVARAAGLPGRARMVGRVLRELPPASRIPWHRVVAAGGRIALRSTREGAGDSAGPREQIARLRAEGVPLRSGSSALRVDLRSAAWTEHA